MNFITIFRNSEIEFEKNVNKFLGKWWRLYWNPIFVIDNDNNTCFFQCMTKIKKSNENQQVMSLE